MNIIDVCKIIDLEIKKQHGTRVNYSKKIKVTKQAFNKWIDSILNKNSGANYSTLESHLNNLGYELKVIKKKPTKK
ncbi:MAG: hypothetical protein ACRCZO_01570 [Cetobacterium sp.]